MFDLGSSRNGAMKCFLGLMPLVLISGDSYLDRAENKPRVENRKLAEAISRSGLEKMALNSESKDELAEILISKNLSAFVQDLDKVYTDDFPQLIKNLKQALDSKAREKSFKDIKIGVSALSEEELETISRFIVENNEPKSILNRIYYKLEKNDKDALRELAEDFLKSKEGESFSLALSRIGFELEEPINAGALVTKFMMVILLGLGGYCYLNFKTSDTPMPKKSDSHGDIVKMRAGAKRKKMIEEGSMPPQGSEVSDIPTHSRNSKKRK